MTRGCSPTKREMLLMLAEGANGLLTSGASVLPLVTERSSDEEVTTDARAGCGPPVVEATSYVREGDGCTSKKPGMLELLVVCAMSDVEPDEPPPVRLS